jgi:hypothetical protein
LVWGRHIWAPVPLQSHNWISVVLAVPPPDTSRHLPSARIDPSPVTVHCWALVPLQSYSCTGVPLAVLAARTSTHLPAIPVIGPVGPDGGGGGGPPPPWVYAAT